MFAFISPVLIQLGEFRMPSVPLLVLGMWARRHEFISKFDRPTLPGITARVMAWLRRYAFGVVHGKSVKAGIITRGTM